MQNHNLIQSESSSVKPSWTTCQSSELRPHTVGDVDIQPRENDKKDCHGNRTAYISKLESSYPLKLMVPEHASSSNAKWLYVISYGGGLVAGDSIHLNITIGTGCCVVMTTQGSTKIYESDGLVSKQSLDATVQSEALLAVLPDPIVCYEHGRYKQRQAIHVNKDGNLILLDWLTAGRMARGEKWQFNSYCSHNSIYVEDKLVFRDCVSMNDKPSISVKQAMGNFSVVAMCVLLGPQLRSLCQDVISRIGKRKIYGYKYNNQQVVSVSNLQFTVHGVDITGVVVRISTQTTVQAFQEIDAILRPLYPRLGGNPFENKY
ncbi:uncharacterized protein LOC144451446 [Glandiceps talaboti]